MLANIIALNYIRRVKARQLIEQLTMNPRFKGSNLGDTGNQYSFKLHKSSRGIAVGRAIDYEFQVQGVKSRCS
jgi:hypothetical protein